MEDCELMMSLWSLLIQNSMHSVVPPPAPAVKAQFSPLANMFDPEPRSPLTSSSDHNSGTDGCTEKTQTLTFSYCCFYEKTATATIITTEHTEKKHLKPNI